MKFIFVPMAGIYVHIPFCKQACAYCNFHFATSLRYKSELVEAIAAEFELKKKSIQEQQPLQSIYFGGGTPSLLAANELEKIIRPIQEQISFNTTPEITLEANPDDLSTSYVKDLIQLGINRLSIGIQSFFEDDLQFMHRAHNASQAEYAVKAAQDAGIENISIDLIYGVPNASEQQWTKNVQKAIELNVPHISAYALTVEENTPLYKSIRLKEKSAPIPESTVLQYQILVELLSNAGFEHYEISNFAKPGHQAIHNSSYWGGEAYWGLGPSAHSFDGIRRRSWNLPNNQNYIKEIVKGHLPEEYEILSDIDLYNEMIMIGLRTSKGCNLKVLENKFGSQVRTYFQTQMNQAILAENAIQKEDHVFLSSKGRMMADAIMRDAFLTQEDLKLLNR
jgi:oxygen-independent coproporphyrinogen-3 oxidase